MWRHSLDLEALEPRQLLAVDLVSVSAADPPVSGMNDVSGIPPASQSPMISGNGRFVAYHSQASNLVETDSNDAHDVFVYDMELKETTLISENSAGTDTGFGAKFRGASVYPTISDDGRFVTFTSFATNLVEGVTVEKIPNVYVRDRDPDMDGIFDEPAETTTRILSVTKEGEGAGLSGGDQVGTSAQYRPLISPNGAFVAFGSSATDLATSQTGPDGTEVMDANFGPDIIRAAVDGSTIEYLSLNSEGTATATHPFGIRTGTLSIDGDGSTVAYQSGGYDIVTTVPEPENLLDWARNVFVTSGGSSTLVSINTTGDNGGDRNSGVPVVSRNGRQVAFLSAASNLAVGATDGNFAVDVYLRDLDAERTILVSRSGIDPTMAGNGPSPSASLSARNNYIAGPALSADGRFVVFSSGATDLLDPAGPIVDVNVKNDIYVLDRDSDGNGIFDEDGGTEMKLVSVNDATGASGVDGFFGASNPSITPNGRFIAFATDTVILPGTPFGMHVYVRDMVTETTYLVSPDGSPAGGPIASGGDSDFNITLSNFTNAVDRVAFVSLSSALDSDVADTNGSVDVFVYSPPTDIRLGRNFATGTTTHSQSFRTFYEDAEPFELAYVRSMDRTVDESDELLGATTVSGVPLEAGTGAIIDTAIGEGEEDIMLPGIGGVDPLEDYFILTAADPSDLIDEFDGDPVNEDNSAALRGLYHLPTGPLFVHGDRIADEMSVTVTDSTLTFDYGPTGFDLDPEFTYDVADVSEIRVRLHEGSDAYSGSELSDIVFGGEGDDKLRGAGGDDTLFGGPGDDGLDGGDGDDTIFGGPGDDTISDGMGDDTIDVGDGDDTLISTPGSDDIFIDGGGIDTLDFSFADHGISIDLDSDELQTVDEDLNTIQLVGDFENLLGSEFDDVFTLRPLPGDRILGGGEGTDTLIVDTGGLDFIVDGPIVSFPESGFGNLILTDFEEVIFETRSLFGDANSDGRVSFEDFLRLADNFGKEDAAHGDGDANGDGEVSFDDFLLLSANFGKEVPRPLGAAPDPNRIDAFFAAVFQPASNDEDARF